MSAHVLAAICTGPNRACRAAHKSGRSVHVIPESGGPKSPRLVMPTNHYRTSAEGVIAIAEAEESAPTVSSDADLFAYREAGMPHFLPVGWIDPHAPLTNLPEPSS
jgi:hypothetical protein